MSKTEANKITEGQEEDILSEVRDAEVVEPEQQGEGQWVKKSVIDLSLGLEDYAASPVKVKKGTVDLALGLEYEKTEQQTKSSVPPSLLKFGLEKQYSNEYSESNGNGSAEDVKLSPELLELLGEANEAWEEKVDERKSEHFSASAADMSSSDILSKLGFSEGLESVGEGETWETKTASAVDEKKPQEDSPEMDPARLMDMLGLSGGSEELAAAGEEAWEKKSAHPSSADLV